MSEIVPAITGTIVPAPAHALSARDIRARDWGQEAAWTAAVEIWLTSVKSQHSRAAYRRDIGLWREWCDDEGIPLDDARRADVDGWRDWLEGAPATIARRMCAVSSFYGYWAQEDVVTRNPAANAARPAVSKAPGSIALARHQAADLLAYVDQLADPRPAVIFRLLAETGMRVSELTSAKVTGLAMSGGHHTLEITRKRGATAIMVVASTTHTRLMAYLGGRADGYILHVRQTERRSGDGQMDRSYVRQLLRRVAREAGLPDEVWQRMHPHVLRHSAATLLAADGVPIHEIQLLLGHESITTTQRYIHHAESLDANPTYRMTALLAKGS